MLHKIFEHIKKDWGTFITNVVSMTAVFLLMNLLIFGFMSIKTYIQNTENSNKGIIYLNTLKSDELNTLQQNLLKENGILSLKFESKETALEHVAAELGIDLDKSENPLSDAIYIYIDNDVDLTQLKNKLQTYNEISDIDLRSQAIEHNRELYNETNRFVLIATIGITLFTLIIVSHIATFNVKTREREIVKNYRNDVSLLLTKTSFFIENIITFILAYLLGFIIYLNIKSFLIAMINTALPDYLYKTTFSEEIIISLLILILVIIISAFVNYLTLHRYYNNKIRYNSSEKEVKEEI